VVGYICAVEQRLARQAHNLEVVGSIPAGATKPLSCRGFFSYFASSHMVPPSADETLTHRLIVPRDANHHGTLYAGVLLTIALEAAYSTAYRAVGLNANLVLKRVLDLRCYVPVPIGTVIEIRGREVHRARAQVIVALVGTPLAPDKPRVWMDGVMQFVQVDATGHPKPLEGDRASVSLDLSAPWPTLRERALRLLAVRS
jgi:acyl-CoA thioesterase YciA